VRCGVGWVHRGDVDGVALGGGIATHTGAARRGGKAVEVHGACEWREGGLGARVEAAGLVWWRWAVGVVEHVAAEGKTHDEWHHRQG